MSDLHLPMMKLLSSKHFPLKAPRRKVSMTFLLKALEKLGTATDLQPAFEALCELKGRGYANTEPKIIMKDEMASAEFEVWLTPLGRTELEKRLES